MIVPFLTLSSFIGAVSCRVLGTKRERFRRREREIDTCQCGPTKDEGVKCPRGKGRNMLIDPTVGESTRGE